MKKISLFAICTAAVLSLFSCARDIQPTEPDAAPGTSVVRTFTGSLEPSTKTTYSSLYNRVSWLTGDAINILGATTNTQATASNFNSTKTHATFTATVTEGEQLYAYYPYDSSVKLNNGKLRFSVGSPQTGVFAQANQAVSKCSPEGNFYFRNATTVLQFVIDKTKYPDAAKLRVEAIHTSEKLTGTVEAEFVGEDIEVTKVSGSNYYLSVDIPSGNGQKTVYVSVIPQTYQGLKFSLQNSLGSTLRTVTFSPTLDCKPSQMYKFDDLSQHLDAYDFLETETFTACAGETGASMPSSAPTTLISDPDAKCDHAGWSFFNCYEGSKCICVCGDGSAQGYAISPAIGASTGWATLTFRAVPHYGSSSARMYLHIQGNGHVQKQYLALESSNKWNDVTVYIQGADENTSIKFTTADGESGFFLDDVRVIDGAPQFNYINFDVDHLYIESEVETVTFPGATNIVASTQGSPHKAYMFKSTGLLVKEIPVNMEQTSKNYTVMVQASASDNVYSGDASRTLTIHKMGLRKVFATPESLEFPYQGSTLTTTLDYWNLGDSKVYALACNNPHFSVSRSGDEITVTAPANSTYDSISGTVSVSVSDGEFERICDIPICQLAEPVVLIDPTSVAFPYVGGQATASVSVKNFVGTPTVTVASDNELVQAVLADGVLTVSAAANTTSTALTANITITASDGTEERTASFQVSVAGIPELTVDPAAVALAYASGSSAVITATAINFGAGTPAVSAQLTSGSKFDLAVNADKITVTAKEANTTEEVYKDTVVVTATLDTISRSVRVPVEQAFEVNVPDPQTISFPSTTRAAVYGTPVTDMVVSGAQTAVSYSISFPAGQSACATIDAATGAVTPLRVSQLGTYTATVTATAAATEDYLSATATYTLTVTLLPTEYTGREYVQGNANKYINTGLTPNSNTRIVIDFQYSVSTNGGFLYGSIEHNYATSYSTNGSRQYSFNSATLAYVNYGACTDATVVNGRYSFPSSFDLTARHTVDQRGGTVYVDGATTPVVSMTQEEFTTPGPLYLLWVNRSAQSDAQPLSMAKAKIYSCQLYIDGTTLSGDYIPCEDNGSDIGLYDLVTQTFLPLQ